MVQGTSTTQLLVSYRPIRPPHFCSQFGAGEVPELFCCLEFEAKRGQAKRSKFCSKLGPLPEPRFQGLVAVRLIGLLGWDSLYSTWVYLVHCDQ